MRAVQFTLFSLCFASYQVYASLDLNMPAGVTPVSREIYNLHMTVLGICVIIGIIVFGTIAYSIIKFRKSKGAVPASFHEHLGLEITWTAIPTLILICIAIPGTLVLINMNDEAKSDVTIKITGFQWKWKYEYLENGISFFSNISTPFDELNGTKPKNPNYLREVDKPLVVPVHKKIRFLITSNDVIHAWWVPELGVKKDAVPGFINETWARINRPGTYRGQCVELCGMNHAFMPIVVVAKSEKGFNDWVTQQGGKPIPSTVAPSPAQNKTPSTSSSTTGTVSTSAPPIANKTGQPQTPTSSPSGKTEQPASTPPSGGQPPQQAPVAAAALPTKPASENKKTPSENATTHSPAVQAAEAAAQAAEATADAAEAVSKNSPATKAAEAAAKAAEATARAAEIADSAQPTATLTPQSATSQPTVLAPSTSPAPSTAATAKTRAPAKKSLTQTTKSSGAGQAANVGKPTQPSSTENASAAPSSSSAISGKSSAVISTAPAVTSATPTAPVGSAPAAATVTLATTPAASTTPSNAASGAAVASSAAPKKTMAELLQHGKEIFEGTCAACHKPDGTGMPPVYPALKGSKIATGPLPAHLNRVLNGKPGTAMQAFRDQFSDDDLAAVITYERNSFGNNTGDAVQPSQIEAAKKLPPTGQ